MAHFRMLVFAALTLVPTVFGAMSARSHDLSRLAQVGLALACSLAVLLHLRHRFTAPVVFALAAVLLSAFVSIADSAHPATAAREVVLLLGLASVVLTIGSARTATELRALSTATAAAAGLYSALLLLLTTSSYWNRWTLDLPELLVGFDNHRFFNHVQTAVLPLLVVATFEKRCPRRIVAIAWCAASVGFALLFATVGRATMAGLMVASIASLAFFRTAALPFAKRMLAAAGAGLVLHLLLFVALPAVLGISVVISAGHLGEMNSVEARLYLWGIALDQIKEAPWFGIGPMHYAGRPNIEAAHPHNIYLQLAAEWGLPMLALLLAVCAWGLRHMHRTIKSCTDNEQATMGIGVFTACIAVAIDGLFSGNFVMPVSQMWIAFTIGWAIAWTRTNAVYGTSVAGIRVRPWISIALGTALLASQLWLCWSIWPQAVDLDSHLEHVRDTIIRNSRDNPRFWSHGWF